MIPVSKGSKSVMPAFPALERVIADVEKVRTGEADGSEMEARRCLRGQTLAIVIKFEAFLLIPRLARVT